ncbi:RpnC/YadD family protein [Dactylococcopsis salina]|uniref:hypothetical protein n=1 Tax=Dactylococcopsis salina TaxID=292566 RepID=UPI00059D5125|nr:hypothetical protein [Dactylococcopsis salina]
MSPEIPEEEELTMPIPQAFLEWEKQVEQRGRKEAMRTIALNLMQTGMSLSQVSEVTGLSLEEVQNLQADHKESNQ